ncbi:MAG: PorV/PorQ family protein [bacterium]
MKTYYIALLIILPVTLIAYSNAGTSGFMFLTISPDARGAGLAGALTSGSADGAAAYYNPAAVIGNEKNFAVTFGITRYFADIYCSYFGMNYNFGKHIGVLGIQFQHLGINDMVETSPVGYGFSVDSLGRTGRKFGARDFYMGISYARILTDELSAGISVKYVQSNIHDYQADQLVYDIGFIFDPHFKTIHLGIVFKNLGKESSFIEQNFPLPQEFNLGLSFVPIKINEHKLWGSFEMTNPVYMENHLKIGMEYSYHEFLFCRLGLKPGFYKLQEIDGNGNVNQNSSLFKEERFSTGLGIKSHYQGRILIDLSYSYTSYRNLDDVHRISLGTNF